MYFLPKNNWAYSSLVNTRPLYRWLASFLLVVGIAYAWLFGIYTPIAQYIDRQITSNASFEQQHMRAKKSSAMSNRLELALRNTENDLKLYVRPEATPSDTLQASMALIFGIAQRHGVTLVSYSVKKESQNDLFITHHIHMDCTGSLDSLINMLDAFYAQHLIIEYERIHVRRGSQKTFSLSLEYILSVFR